MADLSQFLNGGGGGGVPINGTANLQVGTVDIFNASNGEVYLRSGLIETDLSKYPEADAGIRDIQETGVSFDVSATGLPRGITWDGSHFWVVSSNLDRVYQYTSSGTSTGTNFDVSSQATLPVDLTWDGSHFWILDGTTGRVYKYTSSGGYTGVNFNIGNQDINAQGITWDGNHFWVAGDGTNRIYKYTAAGNYTGASFIVSSQSPSPVGITWDGNYFYVVDDNGNRINQYTSDFVFTGVSTLISETSSQGIVSVGSSLWVVGSSLDKVFEYQLVTGVGMPLTIDSDSGTAIYLRVK